MFRAGGVGWESTRVNFVVQGVQEVGWEERNFKMTLKRACLSCYRKGGTQDS